jgi:NitT/TauT family transport system substrate-binding protein
VLGDHKSIWRGGDYPTTLVIVNTTFAAKNPDLVRAFLRAHVASVRFVNTSRPAAQTAIRRQLERLTGEQVDVRVIQRALSRTVISTEFNQTALREYGELNREAGYARALPDLSKLVNLDFLKTAGGR